MKKIGSWLSIGVLTLVLTVGLSSLAIAEDAADGDKAPIEIELPEPFFGGTPLDYWGPNLEPQDYRDRPPFLAPKGAVNVAFEQARYQQRAPGAWRAEANHRRRQTLCPHQPGGSTRRRAVGAG